MTEKRINQLKYQLQKSRKRITELSDEISVILYNMLFVAQNNVNRISTNGNCIFFNPNWLQKLNDDALDFILCHQVMHIILNHINRPKYYKGDRFHLACDIIVNSNLKKIGFTDKKIPGIGKIFSETFFPREEGFKFTPEDAIKFIPFDPATMKKEVRQGYMIDSELCWDAKNDRGENGIIVLSPKDAEPEFLVEISECDNCGLRIYSDYSDFFMGCGGGGDASFNISPPVIMEDTEPIETKIERLKLKTQMDKSANRNYKSIEQMWQLTNATTLNWRKLLNCFIQEEIFDYSFTPPDKRLQESEFFLPDYNVKTENISDILFMVDTSSSVDNKMLSAVYNEIYSAITLFSGNISGMIGFFDTKVYTPQPINGAEDLATIKPVGQGGTNFNCIFDYINKNSLLSPACIIVFTDGKGSFPEESSTADIPVLWLLSNKNITPPWGACAYIN